MVQKVEAGIVLPTRPLRPLGEIRPFRERLEATVSSQVNRLMELGFHKEVYPDLPQEQARARYTLDFTLPEQAERPAKYEGRFEVTLVVDPRVPLERQYELAGIKRRLNLDAIVNVTSHPKIPYLLFTHRGIRYAHVSVEKAITKFGKDEVGMPHVEVVGEYLQHPEFFEGRGIDAAGSIYLNHTPYLGVGKLGSKEEMIDGAGSPRNENDNWGAGSRGKKVIEFAKAA